MKKILEILFSWRFLLPRESADQPKSKRKPSLVDKIVAILPLSREERLIIDKEETKYKKLCEEEGIKFIAFDDFCKNQLPALQYELFEDRLETYKYYFSVGFLAKRGSNVEFTNESKFHAAVVISTIIAEAKRTILMQVNNTADEVLSLNMCKTAMNCARQSGKAVIMVSSKGPFIVSNDVHMRRIETDPCKHSAVICFNIG